MHKLEIDITCPGCSKRFKQRIENIRPGGQRTCPSCGVVIDFAGDDMRKAQRAMDDFTKELKSLGNVKL